MDILRGDKMYTVMNIFEDENFREIEIEESFKTYAEAKDYCNKQAIKFRDSINKNFMFEILTEELWTSEKLHISRTKYAPNVKVAFNNKYYCKEGYQGDYMNGIEIYNAVIPYMTASGIDYFIISIIESIEPLENVEDED